MQFYVNYRKSHRKTNYVIQSKSKLVILMIYDVIYLLVVLIEKLRFFQQSAFRVYYIVKI